MLQEQMDDFSALAQRVAVSVGDVRGCFILSRDGMVLGAYPDEDEPLIKPAWLKFATLGDAERSFVEFGAEIWVYAHRGPYASFAVAGTSVRPGVLLDTMEQALLAAEESRTKREALRLPEAAAAPSGKPRTSMHPPVDRPAKVSKAGPLPRPRTLPSRASPKRGEPKPSGGGPSEDEAEVDRVLLAQEFSGLLQMGENDDEGSS